MAGLIRDAWPRGVSRQRLSAREQEVLLAIARGCVDRDIARELSLTEHQVLYAARSAMAKLGAITRPHAVVRGVAAGYLHVDSQYGEAAPGRTQESAQ